MIRRLAAVGLVLVLLAGCGRAEGVDDTRRALENAGYHEVGIDLRAASGIGVARRAVVLTGLAVVRATRQARSGSG